MAIGERLREARMRQQIDIADVETATKIRAKYLRALENEEFALLPGNTFVKTFLRTYAEYLGLDPQLLLEEYRAGYEPRADSELQPYSVAARRRQRERDARPRRRAPSGPPGPGTAVIVLVVAVLVVFAILGLTSGGDDNGGSKQTKQKTPSSGKGRGKGRQQPAAPTTIKLRAVPTVATYMCVDRGTGTGVVYEGTTSDPQRFHGKHLRINAGNSSVQLRVNKKPVKVPQGGQPIGYEFVLRGGGRVATSTIPSGERPCA